MEESYFDNLSGNGGGTKLFQSSKRCLTISRILSFSDLHATTICIFKKQKVLQTHLLCKKDMCRYHLDD